MLELSSYHLLGTWYLSDAMPGTWLALFDHPATL